MFTKSSHILVKKSRNQINIKNQQSGNTAKILKGRTEPLKLDIREKSDLSDF